MNNVQRKKVKCADFIEKTYFLSLLHTLLWKENQENSHLRRIKGWFVVIMYNTIIESSKQEILQR